jgi:hypothetical protein
MSSAKGHREDLHSEAAKRLFAPLSLAEFIGDYWERRTLVLQGNCEHVRSAFALAFDVSAFHEVMTAIAQAYATGNGREANGPTRATFDFCRYTSGISNRQPFVPIDARLAHLCFSQGASIQLASMEVLLHAAPTSRYCIFPSVFQAVAAEANFRGSVSTSATWSPPGSRFEAHFDPLPTLILQTQGSKRYRFGSTPRVLWPKREAYRFPDGSYRYPDAALAIEAWEFAKDDDPTDWQDPVTLHPGDLLYLPTGVVHETMTGPTPSLSLLVAFGPPPVRANAKHWLRAALGPDADRMIRNEADFRDALALLRRGLSTLAPRSASHLERNQTTSTSAAARDDEFDSGEMP